MSLIKDLVRQKQAEIICEFGMPTRQRELFIKLTDLSFLSQKQIAYELGVKADTLRVMKSHLRERLDLPDNSSIFKQLILKISDADIYALVGVKK